MKFCEVKAVVVLAFLLSDVAKEIYEAYTSNGMGADADVFHKT